MITSILKLLTIFWCSIYISFKSLHLATTRQIAKISILATILTTFSYFLYIYAVETRYIIPLILFWFILSFLNHKPQASFVITTISFGISFSLYTIVSAIVLILVFPYYNSVLNFPYVLLSVFTGILQIFITIKLFQIKRFRNGMPFLQYTNTLNIATVLCLISCCCMIYMTLNYKNSNLQIFAFLFFLFTFTSLIYWWQAQITKTYRRRLELRELESLRAELLEMNEVVQQLKDDNERLARISHRDNSLISALRDSTLKYLSTDYENPKEALEVRQKLIQNINALSEGRASALPNYEKKTARDFDTGLPLLDELLHHMDGVAIENGIILAVHFSVLLNDFVPAAISEEDLVHTVDDLLKNAYKSTLTHEKRLVQLQFFKLGKHFVVEVADNGIPFEARSLVNMGLEALTTYEDGSGIGLMDIWGTKEKYRATYHLDEYETSTPFSKKISLIFDKKNRFSILTSRKNEILKICNRLDLQVYSRNN